MVMEMEIEIKKKAGRLACPPRSNSIWALGMEKQMTKVTKVTKVLKKRGGGWLEI